MEVFFIKMASALLFSFLVTFYLIPIVRKLAFRLQFVDVPDGKTKQHAQAVPYMGGIAVYSGFLVAIGFLFPVENQIFLLLVGATILLCVGLIDDLVILKPHQKVFGQIIAALCFVKAGLFLKEQFFSLWWRVPLSVFWILLIINAFNLVDVMDGLATSIALGSLCSFLIIAFYFNLYVVCILLCALIGALLAFLWFNKPSATIYLGDAGSLFLGGFMAVLPFFFNWGVYNKHGYLTPFIILAIPLLEVFGLIIIRSYKKIPFYCASPDHFSLYLLRNGWQKQTILFYVMTLSAVLGYGAWLFALNTIAPVYAVIIGIIFIVAWCAALLKK